MQPDAKWGIGVSVRVGGEGWGKADESARTGILLTLTMTTTMVHANARLDHLDDPPPPGLTLGPP